MMKKFAIIMLAIAGLAAMGGCSLMDPPETKALYEPKPETMLVLVDYYHAPPGDTPDADNLTAFLYKELKDHNKTLPLIDPDKLVELKDKNRKAYDKMTVSEVGKALGARQILYVSMLPMNMEENPSSDKVQVTMSARVRIVDVASGDVRWPITDDDGMEISGESPAGSAPDPGLVVREKTERVLAERVGRLFHSWKDEDDDSPDSIFDDKSITF